MTARRPSKYQSRARTLKMPATAPAPARMWTGITGAAASCNYCCTTGHHDGIREIKLIWAACPDHRHLRPREEHTL